MHTYLGLSMLFYMNVFQNKQNMNREARRRVEKEGRAIKRELSMWASCSANNTTVFRSGLVLVHERQGLYWY